MDIDSYDWNDLYKKANEFVAKNIPPARVNTGRASFLSGRPRVEISFIAKGNPKYIKLLDEMPCLRKLKGINSEYGRIIRAEIIFNSDGTLN